MLCMLLGILMLGAVTGGGYQHVSVLYTVAGFSDLQVSRMLSLGGGLMIAGKCLFGVITDRFGTSRTAYLFFAFLTGGWLLCCLAGRQSMPLAVLSVVFINLGMALSTVGLSAIARSISSEQGFGRAAKNFQSFTMIGSIAFNTIPGIIAAYRYRFALYNLCENPEISIMEALDMSKRQTLGYKGQLFMLDLSYLGWALLAGVPSLIYSFAFYQQLFLQMAAPYGGAMQDAALWAAVTGLLPAWGWTLPAALLRWRPTGRRVCASISWKRAASPSLRIATTPAPTA